MDRPETAGPDAPARASAGVLGHTQVRDREPGGELPLIALAGNPNTGKSSLFNRLTGLSARVGNYPGVTIDLLSGLARLGPTVQAEVLDIPGAYSLVARSPEEQIAIDRLLGLVDGRCPRAVVACVDATNLVRNLYFVLQLQELGLKTVVALTMTDEARDILPEPAQLSDVLGCPVVATVPRTGEGLDRLRDVLASILDAPRTEPRWRWSPSPPLGSALEEVKEALPPDWPPSRALALWALMSIAPGDSLQHVPDSLRRAVNETQLSGEAIDDEAVRQRYAWLDSRVAPLLRGRPTRAATSRVDAVLLHPAWGFAVFVGLMFVLFQSLFAWADPAISLVEASFAAIARAVSAWLPEGVMSAFITEALIGGVGSVVVFLPQILLLFFLLGMMEDCGYMARIAYLMDRIMKLMHLNGRAFVPMLSGFACAVPAIMATRTMERRRDRVLTMMVVPLMTCSARLPVYTLVVGSLFPAGVVLGFVPVQGGLMIAMYLFSVASALGAAWVLSRTVLPARPASLVMELPPYRWPRLYDVSRMMWHRTRAFLTEAGTVILACTVVLWVLLSFPRQSPTTGDTPASHQGISAPQGTRGVRQTEQEVAGARLRASYAGQLGKLIEPALAPLGFDWKIGIGLIGSFAAREVFVATMGVVYNVGADAGEQSATLRERMRAEVRADGAPVYTPLVGLSLMVFFALACQCMSTVAVVKRETGGWRWPAFLLAYMTALAWLASFVTYQSGRLLGW